MRHIGALDVTFIIVQTYVVNLAYASGQMFSKGNLGLGQTLVPSRPFKLYDMRKKRKDSLLVRLKEKRKNRWSFVPNFSF